MCWIPDCRSTYYEHGARDSYSAYVCVLYPAQDLLPWLLACTILTWMFACIVAHAMVSHGHKLEHDRFFQALRGPAAKQVLI